MRILLVLPWDDEFGGLPYVVGNLAHYLQSRGHEVIFFFGSKSIFLKRYVTKWGFSGFELRMQYLFGERHPIVSLTIFLLLFPIILFQLVRFLHRHRIQVVNVHYPIDSNFYFAICRYLQRIKLVTSVHGADILPNGTPRTKYSLSMKFLLSSSDRIIAVSQAFQNDFLKVFPKLRKKCLYIQNGVNLSELSASNECNAENGQEPYILCIAMHNEKKAVDVLLRAFALLKDIDPTLKLILVGNGPLHQQLKDLAVALSIHKRVQFLGFQGRADVTRLLQKCKVFVLPSRSEPFGIAVIEAMACKKAVVATTVGGIPEIIQDGKDGLLVAPDNPRAIAEALRTLLTDDELRRTLAVNGYITVQRRFCREHTGATYEAVFHDLLGLPRSSAA